MAAPSSTPYKGGGYSTSWIDDDSELARFCRSVPGAVGFDTEFVRVRTFFPRPGLYQLCAGSHVALVDPLADLDWTPFVDLLESPTTVKVMHACTEDLELLQTHLGIAPRNVFDTQMAHAFVSSRFSASYAALVEDVLHVSLGKHETRSNWRRRPLSEEQKRYASEDVIHLVPLHDLLVERLADTGRRKWFDQAMADRGVYRPVAPDEYYLSVRKAWRMDADQLVRLKALCAWREHQARSDDVPRNRVLGDDVLVAMAERTHLSLENLNALVAPAVASRHAETLLAVHAGRHEAFDDDTGVARIAPPLSPRYTEVVKALRKIAIERAETLGMAVELLGTKKDLEALVRCYLECGSVSDAYLGWRQLALGSHFNTQLAERLDGSR